MANVLPINFPIPSETSLINYDFVDIADGTGVITFYPFVARDNTANTYRIDTNLNYSELIETSGSFSGSPINTYSNVFNKTFELSPFNLQRVLKGRALFLVPVEYNVSVSDQIHSAKVAITLFKDSTQIATIESAEYTSGTGVTLDKNFLIELDINQTTIKAGETFKVQVQVYLKRNSGSAGTPTWGVGHDPMNRNGTVITVADNIRTQMIFRIPFKINN